MPSPLRLVPDPAPPPRLTRRETRHAVAVTGCIAGSCVGLAVGLYPSEFAGWLVLAGLMFGAIALDLLAQEREDDDG